MYFRMKVHKLLLRIVWRLFYQNWHIYKIFNLDAFLLNASRFFPRSSEYIKGGKKFVILVC